VSEPLHVFKLPRGRRDSRRIMLVLDALPAEKEYELSLVEKKRQRSVSQNRLLWALYQQIIDRGGEAMQGWEREDLHAFFLGNHHGWDKVRLFDQTRMRPMGRSSNLSKQEFSDYVDSIVRFMAERGVVLDLPEQSTW
jgi:hypothetical protein